MLVSSLLHSWQGHELGVARLSRHPRSMTNSLQQQLMFDSGFASCAFIAREQGEVHEPYIFFDLSVGSSCRFSQVWSGILEFLAPKALVCLACGVVDGLYWTDIVWIENCGSCAGICRLVI